jgi:DNA-binding NtrC family response regulator
MSEGQDMKHSTQDFSQVMKSAIELASFFQDADAEQRNVIKGYFKTCIPDLVSNNPGMELEQGSKNKRQKVEDSLAGKMTNEDDFFIAARDTPNRVEKKKNKRYLIATRTLEKCSNNKELAAKELNISLRTFYRWIED